MSREAFEAPTASAPGGMDSDFLFLSSSCPGSGSLFHGLISPRVGLVSTSLCSRRPRLGLGQKNPAAVPVFSWLQLESGSHLPLFSLECPGKLSTSAPGHSRQLFSFPIFSLSHSLSLFSRQRARLPASSQRLWTRRLRSASPDSLPLFSGWLGSAPASLSSLLFSTPAPVSLSSLHWTTKEHTRLPLFSERPGSKTIGPSPSDRPPPRLEPASASDSTTLDFLTKLPAPRFPALASR